MAVKKVSTRKAPARNGHNGETGLRIEIVTVTPDLAAAWLAKNEKNRGVRERIVDKYARDMSAGNWVLTGEAIKFDTAGVLTDGQHRLYAIVQSNTAVPMVVVSGVDPEAQLVMDTGTVRTAADALQFAGHTYTAVTAAAARLAINWRLGNMKSAHMSSASLQPVTHSEAIQFIEQNPDLEHFAAVAYSSWRRVPAAPSVVCFTAWACAGIDAPLAVEFFDDLAEMRTSGTGDPRQALLRRFQTAAEHRERMSQIQQCDAIFRAWNAVRAKTRLSKINPRFKSDNFTDPR